MIILSTHQLEMPGNGGLLKKGKNVILGLQPWQRRFIDDLERAHICEILDRSDDHPGEDTRTIAGKPKAVMLVPEPEKRLGGEKIMHPIARAPEKAPEAHEGSGAVPGDATEAAAFVRAPDDAGQADARAHMNGGAPASSKERQRRQRRPVPSQKH